MISGRVPSGREEVGEAIASFPTYEGAQKAVSALIAADVPAREIAIVGQGLRSIERVTGRLGYATAARSGAVNGVLLGLLFSFIFVLGMPTVQISAFLGVMLIGVALGMLMSLVSYSIIRRRRDFVSVMQVVADRYEVCVTTDSVHRARQVVVGAAAPAPAPQHGPAQAGPPASAPPASAPPASAPPASAPPVAEPPPRYGERIPSAPPTDSASETARPPASDGSV